MKTTSKQFLFGSIAMSLMLALTGSVQAGGPGGIGGRAGNDTGMSRMSAGARNFNGGGAVSARSLSPSSGLGGSSMSSRVRSPKDNNFQADISSRVGRNSTYESKVGNTGVFGNTGQLNNKAVDPRVTTRPGDLFGKGAKLTGKVLDPRVTTRPGDLFGKNGKLNDKVLDPRGNTRPADIFGKGKAADILKGKIGGKLGDLVGKNGGLKDVIKNSGKLTGKFNGKLNGKFSDKITSKLGKNYLKHAHHGQHHHHHDWWCHKDFWCHNDYWCHSWYFDWCFPWYGPDWCWDYYPDVIIDTYPVYYVSQPVVIETAVVTVDLELVSVELLDVGEPARKLGPRFRVTARNVGTARVDNAIVRLAAGRELTPAAFEKPIEATASIAPLAPGQATVVELRLPVQALAMIKTATGTNAPFEALAAAVEVPPTLTDVNPKNNFSLTPRSEIKLAGF